MSDPSKNKVGFVKLGEQTTIYYELSGVMDGPVITLIHGFSLDHRIWEPQLSLLERNYRILRYDLRGFGRSSVPTTTPYRHCDDLYLLLHELDIVSTVLIGLSLGGEVAIDFSLVYSHMVEAMILSDTSVGGGVKTISSSQKGENVSVSEARRYWLEHPLLKTSRRFEVAKQHLESIINDYSGWHWFNIDPVKKLEPPAITQASKIYQPTLLIIGELDHSDFQLNAILLQSRLPNCTKVTIQSAGHLPNIEVPGVFNRHIGEFLEMT